MDRRRAAGLLLALAACFATATAAPTASNHTSLDLYDGAPDGCYYNFQHYGEGDRIMTNEPCLNCTCHNRMLMCYLRVCPFTKAIGQDCTIEKRADQCCPIVTCPDVPVDLLTSTTTSPAEYGPTGIGKLDKFGCSINGKYFSEGSKVPPTPNKPCEHCYCIRNMTTCVMQECTLHVDGCTPIYHKDVCCPVRYSCDHPEDELPLLDDLSTAVRPTPGFLLTTTTISPVTQISQDCLYDNRIFSDGALIKTEKACDHCYCMKGDIVCVVQECGTPMENEGKNCTALPPREGVCCPDTYICEGDESSTGTYEADEFTTHAGQEKLTTLLPPRRTSSEGSGYRNEPDEGPYTESSVIEPEIEGSGEDEDQKQPDEITTEKTKPESTDDILASTEETHEFIPLTTAKPKEEETTEAEVSKEDGSLIITGDIEKTTESEQRFPSTTGFYSTKDIEEPITEKTGDIGSGEQPGDMDFKPHEEFSVTTVLPVTHEIIATTEMYEQNIITSGLTEDSEQSKTSEPQAPVTNAPLLKEEMTVKPSEQEAIINAIDGLTTSISTIEHDITTTTIPIVEESPKSPESTVSSTVSEETDTKDLEPANLTTLRTPIIEEEVTETTKSTEQKIVTGLPDDFIKEDNLETQHYSSSTSSPSLDDEFVTTETQEIPTDRIKETELSEDQHVTASTPMLEEIEKDTTEYTEPAQVIPSETTQDDTHNILSTTVTNVPVIDNDKDVTESTILEEHIPEEYLPGTTNIPVFDQQEQTTAVNEKLPEAPIDTSVKEISTPEELSPSTTTSSLIDKERKTTPDLGILVSEYDNERDESGLSLTASALDTKETTTEPDKGLNTIPSEGIDEETPVSPEVQKLTTIVEKVTTEADLSNAFSTETEDIISSTISDTSVSREEQSSLTTESAFRKEDYSPTEAQISPKLTTVAGGVTEEVISTLIHDHIKSTESSPASEHETTTLVPKYTESMEETTLPKEISNVPNYESSTLEASVSEISSETPTASTPLHEKETTTANQEDNEIFNEPRIPGEGDCLLNGVTYTNASAVPSTNKCQSGCRCVSSIIKCDPIICSPPPEYMDNCETMYDTPDACCPTYICDHKTETIPPQSHSQMSGTEAPVISPVHCRGDECEIVKDQKHHDEPSDGCISGSCAGPSDEPKEATGYPHSENIPEKPTIVLNEECVGDDCKQVLCTNENGCQVTPVQPCEGEKCETSPEVILPPETQQCAHGEDCAVSSIPPNECIGDKCDKSGTKLEDTRPSEMPQLPEDECKEDHCRRKDSSPPDQHVHESCTAPDCKPTQTDIQTSTAPALEQTSHVIDEDNKKDITEATEKLESFTESSEHPYSVDISGLPETHETVTKQQEITRDESLTTVSDINTLVTKPEPDTTTKTAEYTDEQGVTSGDFVTERDEPFFTESVEYQPFAATETTKKQSDIDISQSSGDVTVEMTDKSITQEDTTDTERPQEFVTTENLTSVKLTDGTETTKVYTPEAQVTTESAEKPKPEDETSVFSEGSTAEPSIPFTMDSHETSSPSIDIKDEISTDTVIDSSTELTKSQDDMKKPDISEHAHTTVSLIQESSTEPLRTFAPELESITGASQETKPTKSTGSIKDDDITEDVLQRVTEPTTIGANEQIGETYQTNTVSEPSEYDTTTVSAITDDFQSITVSKSPDAIHLTEGTEHKDTPSEITEETPTEPSKSSITESLEITKSSETFDQEVTTQKFLERTSTASPLDYTEKQHEITASQEIEKITTELYESVTSPPKTQAETQLDTKSPEDIDRDDITITGTETTESYVTEAEKTTHKHMEESSSKIYDAEDQPITHSSEKYDHKDPTQNIYEASSETSVTDLQMVPEEVDRKETTSEIPDKSVTEPINEYPIEGQQDYKSPIEIDQETTTDNDLDESVTEPPKSFDTEPHISILPEEDTTSMISKATEPPLSYTTVSQDTLKTSEESFATTVKAITESVSSKAEEEVKHELGTSKPITEGSFVESEISETITTSQELSPSKTNELTTPSSISDSKITAPEQEISVETTETPIFNLESKPPQTEGAVETESLVKEQVSTTPVSTDHDIAITVTPLASDSDKTIYTENKAKPTEPEKQTSDIETETTSSPTPALEEVSQADSEATKRPETAAATEKDVSQQIDTEIQVPAFIPTESDKLTTTSSDIHDLTTSKTIESSKPHDVEISTEIAYTPQHEQNTENILVVSQEPSHEKIGKETEKTVLPEKNSTDKPATTANADSTKEIESGTEPLHISSESIPSIQESYTEEPSTKYSSPEPSAGDDSTKAYPDENTVEPIYSKEPEKQIDGLIQSLVTEKYETDTKTTDFEKDSQTPTSTQISSLTPEEDIKQTPQQDFARDELSTQSSISADTTIKELDDKTVISTEYETPVEDTRTESPSYVDKIESETTTQKKPLLESGAVTQEPSAPEQNEVITSTITEHKSTTDTIAIDITTEAIAPDTSFTEKKELAASDKPSVELNKTPTESSYTTEISEKHTESTIEITKIPDVNIQTETSEVVSGELPETPSGVEIPTNKPIYEEHDSTVEDQQATDTLEPGKKQTELSTLEPSTETEVYSQFEPTTAPKQEYPEATSSRPSGEFEHTDEIEEESTKTSVAGELTTESTSSEHYTKKEPETLQPITPEKATPVVEYITTSKQLEPEVYQTTTPAIEVISEMSTQHSVSFEEGSTLTHDIEQRPPTEEHIPVVISETEKTSTSEEPIAVQTEKAPEKPILETTAPEEEFLIATSKATTAKIEEEISTLPPFVDITAKRTDRPTESYSTTVPDAYLTVASEGPISLVPAELVTMAPDVFITSTPEASVTKTPEVSVTTESEALVTKTPDAPVTTEPEISATKASEGPITIAPDAPITSATKAPEMPEALITNAPDAPITSAPEAPITGVPGAPDAPVTNPPKTSITSAPEMPEASIASSPEAPVTNAPEAPITSAPETDLTKASEAPISSAPEASITNAPEEPITSAPETHLTKASEAPISSAPEAVITNAPEAPITSAPETHLTKASEAPISSAPEAPITNAPEAPITSAPEMQITKASEAPISSATEAPITNAPELSVTAVPELPKPVSTEAQPTDEVPTPDEEGSFPPSGGTSGYGQEPDYVEEDQTFGPGTCRYGGKVYVSAQQIPRDDPCDFCFCFRSDIICLQQSCPPPIHGCHEEPIQGFCCPRYECPVSMATTVNVTTTTTTTTTTLPPHFPTHSYKGSVQKRGCQIKGQTYKVGEVVRASSGPCLHCTCGGDGQMKCDPKVCTPEPMLRQMIAAAVSAKRRR